MTNQEHQLNKLKSTVSLTATEKRDGRVKLAAYLAEHPAPASVRSPFSYLLVSARYALALLLIVGATGSGVAFASERAEPGDPLYVVRIRVAEPARIAFVQNPEKRAELEVELVDRRLKDYARVSVEQDNEEKNDKTAALILDSLADRLEDAHKDIQKIRETEAGDYAALDVVSELRATLAAHTEVLEQISDLDTETAEDVQVAVVVVEDSINETDEIATELEAALALEEETDPSAALMSEEAQADASIDAIAEDITEDPERFDAEEYETVGGALEQIKAVVEAADEKKGEGDKKEALRLYGEVNEQTTRLKTLLEADTDLGIDIFGR